MARPNPRTRMRALALAAICAASLGVAACGDDDEPTPTTSTAATGATGTGDSTAAAASEELRTQLEGSGIPPEGVDCIVDALQGELAGATDVESLDLTVVQEATAKCAEETTGGAETP